MGIESENRKRESIKDNILYWMASLFWRYGRDRKKMYCLRSEYRKMLLSCSPCVPRTIIIIFESESESGSRSTLFNRNLTTMKPLILWAHEMVDIVWKQLEKADNIITEVVIALLQGLPRCRFCSKRVSLVLFWPISRRFKGILVEKKTS